MPCQKPDDLEIKDFEYQAYKPADECCDRYKKVRCKVGDKTYDVSVFEVISPF